MPKIIYYDVDFTEFDNMINQLIVRACQNRDDLDIDQIIDYFHYCFEIYVVINQQSLRISSQRVDTNLEMLENKLSKFEIPIFIKDAIREMARPMITAGTSLIMSSYNSNIYLPNVTMVSGKQYLKSFVNNKYKRLITDLMSAMKLQKIYWHHLEIEEIDTLGFSMYHDEKNLISSFTALPQFRFLTVALLKHIRFNQFRLINDNGNDGAGIDSKESSPGWINLDRGKKDQPPIRIDNAIEIFQDTNLTNGFCVYRNNGKVTINSQSLMGTKVDLRDYKFNFDERFPTENKFLNGSLQNQQQEGRQVHHGPKKSLSIFPSHNNNYHYGVYKKYKKNNTSIHKVTKPDNYKKKDISTSKVSVKV